MAFQGISTGSGPNLGDGDTLLDGAAKINSNFSEIYNALGAGTTINAIIEPDGIDTVSIVATGLTVTGEANIDNVTIDGSSIYQSVNDATNLTLYSTGTGIVEVNDAFSVTGNTSLGNATNDKTTVTGKLEVNGFADIDNVTIDGSSIYQSVNDATNLTLYSTGTGIVEVNDAFSVTGNTSLGTVSAGTITAAQYNGSLENTLTLNTSGTGISGSTTYNNSGSTTFTVTSNATPVNIASTIVARSANGDFIAGTITANLNGNVNGNASTASKLQNARAIGGVSFDGSTNINLPGVNTTGNQNTTGNAATADKLKTSRTIGGVSFNGSANINLPGVNIGGNQSTSGNAATATTATNLANAANITTGTINVARLGSGTANNTTFLRGDNAWASIDATSIKDSNTTVRAQATTSGVTITGDLSFTGNSGFSGFLKEQGVRTSQVLSSDNRIFLNQGMVWRFTGVQTNASAPNIKYAQADSIKNYMSTGDVINITLIVPVNGGANQFLFSGTQLLKIDGTDIATFFIGGARPTSNGTGGVDIYNITIFREAQTGTVTTDFFALVSQVKTQP